MVLLKYAFFWVKVEVIYLQLFEYMSCQLLMSFYMPVVGFAFLWSHVYSYVIHVDCDVSFIYEVAEDGVHHSLEGGW